MNLNKVFLIGNLTRDPEMRTLPSGKPVATFGIATNRVWNNAQGEKQQAVEFHNITLFGRLAEIASQYLTKGGSVLIEGRLQTRSWEGKDGIKRNRTEIIGESMQLGPRRERANPAEQSAETSGAKTNGKENENIDTIEYPGEDTINPDDIPF